MAGQLRSCGIPVKSRRSPACPGALCKHPHGSAESVAFAFSAASKNGNCVATLPNQGQRKVPERNDPLPEVKTFQASRPLPTSPIRHL